MTARSLGRAVLMDLSRVLILTVLAVACVLAACSVDHRTFAGAAGGHGGNGVGGEEPVPCTDGAPCDDQNPCTEDACGENGLCVHAPINAAPDDNNDCTTDTCDGATEKHDFVEDGTPCGVGGNLLCENGVCKGCTVDEDCGTDEACITHHCDTPSQACSNTKAEKDTPIDGGESGDCKKRVCDGNGNIVPVADVMDKPAGDGNPCRIFDCDGMEPIQGAPQPSTTVCVTASCSEGSEQPESFCDGQGACAPKPVVPCALYACGDTVCEEQCADDTDCSPGAFCQGAACVPDLPNGDPCTAGTQCTSGFCAENVCCEVACNGTCQSCAFGEPGKCVFVPGGAQDDSCGMDQRCRADNHQCEDLDNNESPVGGPCDQVNQCDGTGNTCSDGFCNMPSATPCANDLGCIGQGTCENGYCSAVVPRACNPGNAWLCASNFCKDFVCVACAAANDCPENGTCIGGACPQVQGTPCNQGAFCASGFCEDGVCCNNACSSPCSACSADLKQSGADSGTCGPSKAGQPDGPCMSCDGNGNCP